jgi:hypothetical protein
MRATILFLIIFVCSHFSVEGSVFIFKSGKSIHGEIRYEDHATIRIMEKSGLEMTLRKSELNLSATTLANQHAAPPSLSEQEKLEDVITKPEPEKRRAKLYTNRDVKFSTPPFLAPQPETNQAWQKSIAKLEREFVRLQGACRGAGTGANLSKVLRSHTYTVNGKPVRITGYWADPANIEEAKQICARAIAGEETLNQARRSYRDYLERKKNQHNSLSAQ